MNALYQWLNTIGYTHPLHPTQTYVPIGMVIGALAFGSFALLSRRSQYAVTARHCITLAFIGVFPTILLGYLDWQHFHGGAWIFEIRMKIALAISLSLLLLASLFMHMRWRPGAAPILLVYLLAFVNVVALGYFGGELVFGGRDGAHTHSDAHESDGGRQTGKSRISYADVRPIFEENCTMCHQGADAPEDLRLTSYEEIMEGADGGKEKVVIAGKPDESELVERVKGIAEPRMPLNRPPLAQEQIKLIVDWIAAGAPNGHQGH